MGRPEVPLERDGSCVREFAFWLRDLRSRSGLTYDQLAKQAHYATSTVQAATSGQRFPTLRVVMAFVRACEGDLPAWRAYWTQIHRMLDADAPAQLGSSALPPWAGDSEHDATRPAAAEVEPGSAGEGAPDLADDTVSWYVESFTALLRLDCDPIEATEQRVVVASAGGLSELLTSVSVPRRPGDARPAHDLEAELLYGGRLEQREHPYESFFRNVIALPRPLQAGDRHEYALRLRIPPGQPMASHYVHVPLRRSDRFELRVRFDPANLPRAVWRVAGVPTAVIYEGGPASQTITPDRFGEIRAEFRGMRIGLGYGICWQEAG